MADIDQDSDAFIAKWQGVAASELSTSQSFLCDLCVLLGVDTPHWTPAQDYMFERPITFSHGDGSTSPGRIDLYRRGAFVLESKKLKAPSHTAGFDAALLRARSQAEGYARALPASEGRPPFVVVVDVGNRIELYAEFSQSGATYTPFPDPGSHRISLVDLRRPAIRERLRRVWDDPLSLDPSRESARVTREIAGRLATLARSLEYSGHSPEAVAQFLMRCLFTMFAEDVTLLPPDCFRELLLKHAEQPDVAMRMLGQLWRDMDSGGFSAAIASDVLRFNGKLFKQPDTLPLDGPQIQLLIDAARAKWEHVEPAIFGTLLERALTPSERHKLGAHYTPRAYVERLVLPTVIEPLRSEFNDAQAAAMTLAAEGRNDEAVTELLRFHHRLCTVRVLDPACGSGNFLYVTLEHLKRLEGEVLNALDELGYRQTGLALGSERADAVAGETVDPHNLLGIELNPRAAAIAEVVLWIGYLQWHFRTRGDVSPPVPVIRDFRNIENRDAVLAYDRVEFVLDERGSPVTNWDGETMKKSSITDELIPDDNARKPVERFVNPRRAAWPSADFVVGNPPFIGNKRMRTALGDGYVEALRGQWPDVPDSADFVMYWWHHAAQLARHGALQRFGFITTNSIRQVFNRRVIETAMAPPVVRVSGSALQERPLSLLFAIPDHPWVDVADGAAVRIAMTVAGTTNSSALLREVISELEGEDETAVTLRDKRGALFADLKVGADVASAKRLRADSVISNRGVIPHGEGMTLNMDQALTLGIATVPGLEQRLRPYRNGRDLTQISRNLRVIDMHGLTSEQVREQFPSIFQWLLERVKPERDQNSDRDLREKWWLHRRNNDDLRRSLVGLSRYIATVQTAKHRLFVFLSTDVLPDDKLIAIASEDALLLGVLSSQVHAIWALAAGARLGVGNDPVYNKSTCFECFPFPAASESDEKYIRSLADELDNHRRRQQAAHPDLTLTGMYNVLDKLRSGEPLTKKERKINDLGLVSVLRQLHDELDAAVLGAYGWSDLLPVLRVAHREDGAPPAHPQSKLSSGALQPAMEVGVGHVESATGIRDIAKRSFEESILDRLVALNAERAAEEARGLVRWLRPDYQRPAAESMPTQIEMVADTVEGPPPANLANKPLAWPKDAIDQVRAVVNVLTTSPAPLAIGEIAQRFKGRGQWKRRLPPLLDMLVALGRSHQQEDGRFVAVSGSR